MPPRTKASRLAQQTYQRLFAFHPDADCELQPRDPFHLLVAVVLSAQTTDIAVNRVLPGLFAKFPDVAAFASAEPDAVALLLNTLGMFRQKARHLVGLSKQLIEFHEGRVPQDVNALVKLPGVGPKTANVVMGVAFGTPSGVVVDTHVQRLAQRLGWTTSNQPDVISAELGKIFPKDDWIMLCHVLIFHGRRVCTARAPACGSCPVMDSCPSAGKAENIGRKPKKSQNRASTKQD